MQQRFEPIELKGVVRVALGAGGLFVHLEEHAIDARGDSCRRQRLDVLRESGRDAVAAARELEAVRRIEHDGKSKLTHHRQGAHVDDQVVIAKAGTTLGHDDA